MSCFKQPSLIQNYLILMHLLTFWGLTVISSGGYFVSGAKQKEIRKVWRPPPPSLGSLDQESDLPKSGLAR